MHGAGLINCGFSRRRVVTFEVHHNFGVGFDGFMKVVYTVVYGIYLAYTVILYIHIYDNPIGCTYDGWCICGL